MDQSTRCQRLPWTTLLVAAFFLPACSGGPKQGTTDPEVKLRLERLLEIYRNYADQRKAGPPNEKALRDFITKLPQGDRETKPMTAAEIDALLTSPRDNQKFVVKYGARFDPGAEVSAIAWEATATGGKRWVANSMGYVEECDEEQFKELTKKK